MEKEGTRRSIFLESSFEEDVNTRDPSELLIENLVHEGLIKNDVVRMAFNEVHREFFVPEGLRRAANDDRPLPIGNGQTISAPHMVAIMSEELLLRSGMKVLEIGTGSGYHAAVTSRIVGEEGSVHTIERVHSLYMSALRNISETGIENVFVHEGDGSKGYPPNSPYDRIYYTCGAPDIPGMVFDQVKDGGMILAPIGPKHGTQRLTRFTRRGEEMEIEKLTYCVFVPLIGELGY